MDRRELDERGDRGERDLTRVDRAVQLARDLEQLEAVTHPLRADRELLADPLARQARVQQPRERRGLLERRVVAAMQVLNDRVNKRPSASSADADGRTSTGTSVSPTAKHAR